MSPLTTTPQPIFPTMEEVSSELVEDNRPNFVKSVEKFNDLFREPGYRPVVLDRNNEVIPYATKRDLLIVGTRLVVEELRELQVGMMTCNKKEIADALCDIAVVVHGLAMVAGLEHDYLAATNPKTNAQDLRRILFDVVPTSVNALSTEIITLTNDQIDMMVLESSDDGDHQYCSETLLSGLITDVCYELSAVFFNIENIVEGLNLEENVEEVCRSNMTKFTKSLDVVKCTIDKYAQAGVNAIYKVVGTDPDTQEPIFAVLRGSDGKLLKPTTWEAPQIKVT